MEAVAPDFSRSFLYETIPTDFGQTFVYNALGVCSRPPPKELLNAFRLVSIELEKCGIHEIAFRVQSVPPEPCKPGGYTFEVMTKPYSSSGQFDRDDNEGTTLAIRMAMEEVARKLTPSRVNSASHPLDPYVYRVLKNYHIFVGVSVPEPKGSYPYENTNFPLPQAA